MAVAVRRTDAGIEVENQRLRLLVHRATLRMQLSAHRSPVGFRGFRPRLLAHEQPILAIDAVGDECQEIETPLGAATRLHLVCRGASRIDLRLRIDIGPDWPGFVLELSGENRGEGSVRISAMDPLFWSRAEEGELELPGPPGEWRFFRMGYQSWSPAGFAPLRGRDPRPRLPLLRRVHYGPFTPPAGRGHHVSDFATRLGIPESPGLTLGFLTHQRFLNHVSLRHRWARVDEVTARVSTEGLRLAPQEQLCAERLWVGVDSAGSDGIATWAERAGREMNAPAPAEVGSGWCSWYQYQTKLSAEHVRAAATALKEECFGIETVQVDDGFQAAVGDWLEPAAGFPEGIAPLAAEIRAAGFQPGLWLAPFLVSRASRVAEQHPDWLLRGPSGRPRVANVNPAWKGLLCYALDPTHPEVLAWLREVGQTVRAFGFRYLKLDFLYAGALAGRRRDPTATCAAAYRSGLAALREGAAPDPFVVGCGAPLGPSIGLVEAMRIGPDVASRWRARGADLGFGIRSAPSAENGLRNVLARAPLHQRLWINDPDCVLVRDSGTRLRDHQVKTLAGAVAASGGLVVVSDDLARVGPERRRLLRRMLPAIGLAPELAGVRGEIPDCLVTRFPDGSALVLQVNLGPRRRSLEIDLVRLGFEGSVHVYDVWAEEWLGTRQDTVRVDGVPRHGSALLRISPADGRARVVGSTLHLGAGAIETAEVRAGAGGTVSVTLDLPGRREGKIHVASGDGACVPIHVGFESGLTLEVQHAGVEESTGIQNR